MKKIIWAGFVLAGLGAASPITFTISGTVNGSLNGTPFTGATITFTQVTDTTGNTSCGTNDFCSAVTVGNTVTISGVPGSFALGDPTFFFDFQGATEAGFADTATADIFILSDPSFATYALQTSFGPLVNAGLLGSSNIPTSGGALIFGNVGSTETFRAVVASTPEPGSLRLMLAGGVALAGLMRKRNWIFTLVR